jgi:glutamate-1-semialdehyde 2,1-aminomutase
MEPMNSEWPKQNFLTNARELAHRNGALFVLDEVITGFRYALGGTQEFFGVVPDLACFGKAIANGYPLSAIAGRAEVMRDFEKIHFSFTNAGECLSLAACQATLKKLKANDVPEWLFDKGMTVRSQLGGSVVGHPSWLHWAVGMDPIDKTKYIQEFVADGILSIGTFNLSTAHTNEDLERLVASFTRIRENLKNIELRAQPLGQGFKIR